MLDVELHLTCLIGFQEKSHTRSAHLFTSIMAEPTFGDELPILTPIGIIGYTFSEDLFRSAVKEQRIDAIIADRGLTDGGPSKLGLGKIITSNEAYERDLGVLIAACHKYRIPILLGSAGGGGANAHVDLFLSFIASQRAIARCIYAEVDRRHKQEARNW